MASLKQIGVLGSIASNPPNRPVKPPKPNTVSGRPPLEMERPSLRPRGPRALGLGVKRIQRGPGPPPEGFEGTIPEWVWYFASAKLLDNPKDPRQPPFTGARDGSWLFQVPELPGEARQVGGSISDFVYVQGSGFVIVRIETFYWHTSAPPAQQARDFYLTTHAANDVTRVERIEDGWYMGDTTGATAVRLLAEALSGVSRIGSVHSGLVEPPRYAEFLTI